MGIADKAIWESAGSKNEKGVFFLPNIPTEEVFTAPHKEKVRTASSTAPSPTSLTASSSRASM